MTEQATETPVAELPERLWVVLVYYPHADMVSPVWVPLPLERHFGMPVFSEREWAEEFVDSPNFDVPYIIKEITLEQFIEAGEVPVADDDEIFYMVDPSPMHEWEGAGGMGDIFPIALVSRVLRDELES